MDRIALLEIGGSHDECLLSQVIALKSIEVSVILILDKKTASRNSFLNQQADELIIYNPPKNAVKSFLALRKLAKTLQKAGVKKLVFNTAQGGHVRNFSLLLDKKITCYGIIHTIKKFENSFTQNIIFRRVKRFLVLSDDLLAKAKPSKGIHVESFYPLDFLPIKTTIQKPANEVWITITGEFENRRKDVMGLFELVQQTPENVRFILLGKAKTDDDEVRLFFQNLKDNKLTNKVVVFDHFVEESVFLDFVQQSDFLLPLIHPATKSAEEYINRQISGAFTLAYSFAVPLLIHRQYNEEKDFSISASFYEPSSFSIDLTKAIQQQQIIKSRIQSTLKWHAQERHEKYVRFLGLKEIKLE